MTKNRNSSDEETNLTHGNGGQPKITSDPEYNITHTIKRVGPETDFDAKTAAIKANLERTAIKR